MPTFDFQCRICSTVFEATRPIGTATKPACPRCKSKRVEKLLIPPTIHFKGTGFYKTDSVKKPESKPAPAPEKPAPEAAKTETTPAVPKQKESQKPPLTPPRKGAWPPRGFTPSPSASAGERSEQS